MRCCAARCFATTHPERHDLGRSHGAARFWCSRAARASNARARGATAPRGVPQSGFPREIAATLRDLRHAAVPLRRRMARGSAGVAARRIGRVSFGAGNIRRHRRVAGQPPLGNPRCGEISRRITPRTGSGRAGDARRGNRRALRSTGRGQDGDGDARSLRGRAPLRSCSCTGPCCWNNGGKPRRSSSA